MISVSLSDQTCVVSPVVCTIAIAAKEQLAADHVDGAGDEREAEKLGIPLSTIDAIVRAFCFAGRETTVHFRIRAFLGDPGDAGAADAIVTHNVRHFAGAGQFGLQVLTPREFCGK